MSFDLGFWWEGQEISPDEAARKYLAMVEGDTRVVSEHPALEGFYGALTSRYPDLDEENLETSPWAVSLYRTGECVITSISYSRQWEVCDFVLELAREYGITSYDPQSQQVHFPGDGSLATLELANGAVIKGANLSDVIGALRVLSEQDWYVILETEPGKYIQVGLGETAGAPAGSYALEFREGSNDQHIRAITGELVDVIDAFSGFFSDDFSWRAKFHFSRAVY